jgi:hypothetical protein
MLRTVSQRAARRVLGLRQPNRVFDRLEPALPLFRRWLSAHERGDVVQPQRLLQIRNIVEPTNMRQIAAIDAELEPVQPVHAGRAAEGPRQVLEHSIGLPAGFAGLDCREPLIEIEDRAVCRIGVPVSASLRSESRASVRLSADVALLALPVGVVVIAGRDGQPVLQAITTSNPGSHSKQE